MRFKESGGAQKALDGLTAAGSQLNGAHCVLRVLEGMDEGWRLKVDISKPYTDR